MPVTKARKDKMLNNEWLREGDQDLDKNVLPVCGVQDQGMTPDQACGGCQIEDNSSER